MTAQRSEHVYRVDKFVVPAAGREEFLGKVQRTHEVLKTQPGFVRDLVLEKSSGPGDFNVVTMVEWENNAAIEGARRAVMDVHARIKFDPHELFARLGIKADMANYEQVDA